MMPLEKTRPDGGQRCPQVVADRAQQRTPLLVDLDQRRHPRRLHGETGSLAHHLPEPGVHQLHLVAPALGRCGAVGQGGDQGADCHGDHQEDEQRHRVGGHLDLQRSERRGEDHVGGCGGHQGHPDGCPRAPGDRRQQHGQDQDQRGHHRALSAKITTCSCLDVR